MNPPIRQFRPEIPVKPPLAVDMPYPLVIFRILPEDMPFIFFLRKKGRAR